MKNRRALTVCSLLVVSASFGGFTACSSSTDSTTSRPDGGTTDATSGGDVGADVAQQSDAGGMDAPSDTSQGGDADGGILPPTIPNAVIWRDANKNVKEAFGQVMRVTSHVPSEHN